MRYTPPYFKGDFKSLIEEQFPVQHKMHISGQWVDSSGGEVFERSSPSLGRVVGNYPAGQSQDVDAAVLSAKATFDSGVWSRISGRDRAEVLLRTADLLEQHAEEMAYFETLESGKVISASKAEVLASADIWRFCAAMARSTTGQFYSNLGRDLVASTVREPVGVVSMITPWNFPLLVLSQKLPFALAAGCTIVLKPSEFTPATTLMTARLLEIAGLPSGVLNVITGFGLNAGQPMLAHQDVDMISFTGSTRVGKLAIQESAKTIKKVSLELGGKNAQLVFADCDIDIAADAVLEGAFKMAGESCNCGSRVLVERKIFDSFFEKCIELTKSIRVGDPFDPATQMGAIIHEEHIRKIEEYVDSAISEGANCPLPHGRITDDTGLYYRPILISNVSHDAPISKEEVFGPVAVFVPFDSEDEAVEIANATDYGLSTSLWTNSYQRIHRLVSRLEAGTVWVNTYLSGPPELPFGGAKQSGLGRENGLAGFDEFTDIKTIQYHSGVRPELWNPT